MKECKIIHIHDGKAKVIQNENFLMVEEFQEAEKLLNSYLAQGYEVKHIVSNVSPNILKKDNWSFYKDGFTFYLEKEIK